MSGVIDPEQKDPSSPEQYQDDMLALVQEQYYPNAQEIEYDGYQIKAGNGVYDENGDSIPTEDRVPFKGIDISADLEEVYEGADSEVPRKKSLAVEVKTKMATKAIMARKHLPPKKNLSKRAMNQRMIQKC